MKTVLEGIRVLEMAHYHVGPMAGAMLSDMGAEVIKLEDLGAGDVMRGYKTIGGIPAMTAKGSAAFVGCNRGKKGIVVDLKKPEGREVVYHLLPKIDVFLTSYRRPALARLGMDYETLKPYSPRLIYACANAYGRRGPDANLPGTDYAGQARGGLLAIQRGPEDEPWAPYGMGDQMGSISTVHGILAALLARERHGIGQEVDTSVLGGVVWLQALPLNITLLKDMEFGPHSRQDAANPTLNLYWTADGKWLCLSMGTSGARLWERFCDALGHPELCDDPRFHDLDARNQHRHELISILDAVFLERTRDEWLNRLSEYDCQAAAVNRLIDLPNDPQVMENGYITEYDDPVLGRLKVVGSPAMLSETPMRVASPAPEYGEHTEQVLQELCDYSWDDLTRLRDSGVIL